MGSYRLFNWGRLLPQLILLVFFIGTTPATVYCQDEEDEEGIFWDDEEYGDEEEYYDEDEYEDEYIDDEEYIEEDEYSDEEYEEDYEETEGDEYSYGAEEDDEVTDLEFTEEAKRKGYSIQVTAASPGYVNYALSKWNSFIDYRGSIDFPFLMQIGNIKFRFGLEAVTFRFENYLPIGGKFSGIGFLGLLSFPAGPSTVQFGAGMMGSSPAVTASQSFGLSIGTLMDLRVGIRSTTAINLPDVFTKGETNASWLDMFVAVGYTL